MSGAGEVPVVEVQEASVPPVQPARHLTGDASGHIGHKSSAHPGAGLLQKSGVVRIYGAVKEIGFCLAGPF